MRHRLNRTLRRKPSFHPIENDDLKYLWAAYKLDSFGKHENLSQDDFRSRTDGLLALTDVTYTLVAKTRKGKIPVGLFSGNFNGPLLFIGNALWFKWATDRNKLEVTLHALNELRKEYVVIMHNHMDDKNFYETLSQYGVIRKVGQFVDVYEDGPAQVWQTRKLKWVVS